MEVRYKKEKLKEFLNNHRSVKKEHGKIVAKKVKQRLEELHSAETLNDMPPAANTHPHSGAGKGNYTVDLDDGKRLYFILAGNYEYSGGGVNRNTVTEIVITKIGNPH